MVYVNKNHSQDYDVHISNSLDERNHFLKQISSNVDLFGRWFF